VNKSISTVKFRKNHCFWCNFFHNLPVGAVCVSIHRGKCYYWSLECEFFPEVLIHKFLKLYWQFISKKNEKSNFFDRERIFYLFVNCFPEKIFCLLEILLLLCYSETYPIQIYICQILKTKKKKKELRLSGHCEFQKIQKLLFFVILPITRFVTFSFERVMQSVSR